MYIITVEQLHLLCCVIYDFIYSFKDTTTVVSLKV